MDALKRIFNKDLDAAFRKAREDERELCEKENTAEREKEIRRLENKYLLQIKLLEQKNASLENKIKDTEEKEKILDEKEFQIKEARIVQRRLASDLVSIAKEKMDFDSFQYKRFVRVQQDIINSECDIIGIPERTGGK